MWPEISQSKIQKSKKHKKAKNPKIQTFHYFLFLGVLQHTFYKLHASATETMSELNITLEHQHPITNNPSISNWMLVFKSNVQFTHCFSCTGMELVKCMLEGT